MIIATTNRLTLRQLSIEDTDFVFDLYTSEGFLQHIGDRGINSKSDAQRFIKDKMALYEQGSHGLFVAQQTDNGQPVGVISYFKRPWLELDDIGYALLPECEGNGFAREATQGFIDFLKQQGRPKALCAIVSPENAGSVKLLEKLDFEYHQVIVEPDTKEQIHSYVLDLSHG